MALRAVAMRPICSRSAGVRAMASSPFCNSLMRAEVAAMSPLNACSTTASVLSTSASVRAALVSVRPVQRVAVCTRCVISRLKASDSACALAERTPATPTTVSWASTMQPTAS